MLVLLRRMCKDKILRAICAWRAAELSCHTIRFNRAFRLMARTSATGDRPGSMLSRGQAIRCSDRYLLCSTSSYSFVVHDRGPCLL